MPVILALWMTFALHPLEAEGVHQLYNLDYARATARFEALSEAVPSSPAGPHYLATVLWMEELTRRDALASETFLTRGYWTERQEPVSPELERAFRSHIEESVKRAETRLADHPNDAEALYFLGANEALVSGFEATLKRAYFAAYRAGRRANGWHERLMTIEPDNADACLVPGLYQYTLATLPRSLKILAFLIGERGSKEKGYELIERAAREGVRSHWGARLMLVVVQQREKRYSRALSLLRELQSAFPRNPLFAFERGWVYILEKDWSAARRVFEEVLRRRRRSVPNFPRLEESRILLRLGESLLGAKTPRLAVDRLSQALDGDGESGLRALAHLRRGQAYDLLGERERARKDYQAVLKLGRGGATPRLAKRYLKRPFR